MFSRACEYAIRAVIYIASLSKKGEKVGLKDICKAIEAPEYFTAKILQNLTKQRVIRSSRGPTGGFYIPEGQEVHMIDVVTVIDGDHIFYGCGLGLNICSEEKPCPIHNQFKSIREDLRELMETTTARQMAEDLEKGKAFLRTMPFNERK